MVILIVVILLTRMVTQDVVNSIKYEIYYVPEGLITRTLVQKILIKIYFKSFNCLRYFCVDLYMEVYYTVKAIL